MLPPFPIMIRAAAAAGFGAYIAKLYNNRDMGDLSGSEWAIDALKNESKAQINSKISAKMRPSISFKEGGQICGFGGTNAFFGQYNQDGDKLTLGMLASTRKASPQSDFEVKILQALRATRRFKGSVLAIKLYDDNDDILLSLKRI